METRAAAAVWGDDGRLTLLASTQNAQMARDEVGRLARHRAGDGPRDPPDVGGGFGAKIGGDPEFALVALARQARPAGRSAGPRPARRT